MLKFELITSTESSFDIDNDDYKPIDISEKYRTHNISKPSLSDKIVNIPIDKLETDQIPILRHLLDFHMIRILILI